MTVFEHVLWMLLNLRLLGREPRQPRGRERLIDYAVALQLEYSRTCAQADAAPCHSTEVARRLIDLIGLAAAAEPLPRHLLPMLQRHLQERAPDLHSDRQSRSCD